MEKKPLLPTNDYVFKRVFGENPMVLGSFLKAVLTIPEEEPLRIEILNPDLLPEYNAEKYCILDIKLRTQRNEVIDVEMQVGRQDFIWKRLQFYAAKLLTEQSRQGGEYGPLPQVVSILIAGFTLIPENDRYHHCFRFYDELARVRFPDSMAIHVLELPKARTADGTPLHDWMQFFRAREEEDFEMIAQANPAIAEAWGVIKRLSASESERMIAESREKAYRDYVSGINSAKREGIQEGLQQGRREVARNALSEKLPMETVVKLTGLSLDEVRRIAAE